MSHFLFVVLSVPKQRERQWLLHAILACPDRCAKRDVGDAPSVDATCGEHRQRSLPSPWLVTGAQSSVESYMIHLDAKICHGFQ